ncbi:MAG: tenascin-X [Myxococcota bacterium]
MKTVQQCPEVTPPGRKALVALAVLGVGLTGCTQDSVVGVQSRLRLEPASLVFEPVWVDGKTRQQSFLLFNDGKTPLPVTWTALDAPFSAELPAVAPPGQTSITVSFTASAPGIFSRWLTVGSEGLVSQRLGLEATVNALPACEASSSCAVSTFDVELGRCVETSAADGTVCAPGTKCVTAATCQAGRCVGAPVNCDDQNLCTVDVCYPETGCENVPGPPCPGDGKCQLGVCHPATGCGLAPAADGTTCGTLNDCNAAEVCIAGACVVRDPPDGFVCAEASACQDEGRCVGDRCVRADPSTLSPTWTFDATTTGNPQMSVPPLELHDFVLEPSGAASLSGFFQASTIIRANTANALTAPLGPSRRCIFWGNRLVCADYPAAPNGRVTAMDPSTGVATWSFDLRTARPDFLTLTTTLFLARLVVQGPDRLAALYEAYPRGVTGADAQYCRTYFLVVLNAAGGLVMAQQVTDPLLSQCNHPHPYGVASDAVGNLYIAFSPTSSQSAPLVPGAPTLLMSYTHDGLFRWKLTDTTLVGGELAVARGLLYPENGSVVLHATSGLPAVALPTEVGRAVVADARFVPAPKNGTKSLTGYEAGLTAIRWTHTLKDGWRFWGEQLRLAEWTTSRGPRTVALTFVTDETMGFAPVYALHGIDVMTGAEAFLCPLSLAPRTVPQLLEVANGSLTFMEGALDADGNPACQKCDPPFAGSSATFRTFAWPGLRMAQEPWVGTFGGADHDHHEDVATHAGPN